METPAERGGRSFETKNLYPSAGFLNAGGACRPPSNSSLIGTCTLIGVQFLLYGAEFDKLLFYSFITIVRVLKLQISKGSRRARSAGPKDKS